MLPAKKRGREWSTHGGHGVESSSVDVTPKRPHKRQRIRRRSRKPDPYQSSTTSSRSSLSNTGMQATSARKELKFSSVSETVGLLVGYNQWPHVIKSVFALQPKTWSEGGVKALVNYVRCHGHAKAWPATKKVAFRSSAADFIVNCNPESSRRTSIELTFTCSA